MSTIKMEVAPGDRFHDAAQSAFRQAAVKGQLIEFDFNGIKCIVGDKTWPDLLYRDYSNAHTMGWATIGPDVADHYSPATLREMADKREAIEKKNDTFRKEMKARDNKQRADVNAKIANIAYDCTNLEVWNSGREKNKDLYGSTCYEYAEQWGRLMQAEIASGKVFEDVAQETSFQLGFMGITGFMYGAAVSILANTWRHGEALKNWHNKKYNHKGDGVVNPAMLTIK